jgi:hypothetical protein
MALPTKPAKEARESIGFLAAGWYRDHKTDRQTLEQQWLKNLRQYRGKYDPDIEARIPADRSKVYPKETHTKVVGFVAKMMEMMFPASDRNWDIQPTTIPSIPQQAITDIINRLAEEGQGQPVTPEAIETEVKKYADERAKRMANTIEDQLLDLGGEGIDYPQLCKKVLRSGGINGIGVLIGPQVQYKTERHWEQDPATGAFVATEKKIPRPYFEFDKVWDIFPDLSAQNWRGQDRIFRRMIMNRHQVRLLSGRDGFYKKAIDEYLRDNPTGDYQANTADTELNTLNHTENIARRSKTKYEVVRMVGYLSGRDLFDAGVAGVTEDDATNDVLADVWLLGQTPICIDLAPFGDNPVDMFHAFIFEEDEDSGLTGTGMPENLRDSQMRLCSIDRATQDNMAVGAGPIFEVNEDLLPPGAGVGTLHAFKVINRQGPRSANTTSPPTFRNSSGCAKRSRKPSTVNRHCRRSCSGTRRTWARHSEPRTT